MNSPTLRYFTFIVLLSTTIPTSAQSSYQDTILNEAVQYFKKPKSEVSIYKAKIHLDSVHKYFTEGHELRGKLDVAFSRMSKDKALLKKEDARVDGLVVQNKQSFLGSWPFLSVTLFMLLGLMSYLAYKLYQKTRELNKRISSLNSEVERFVLQNIALETEVDETKINMEDSLAASSSKAASLRSKLDTITAQNSLNSKELSTLNDKYGKIIDIEERHKELLVQYEELREKYRVAHESHKKLVHDNAVIQDNLDLAEFGIYEPHFDFDTSERFKIEMGLLAEKRKAMVRNKTALNGSLEWRNYSQTRENRSFLTNMEKILLRAFNGECDKYLEDVRWNTMLRYQERMQKACDAINKLGAPSNLFISNEYLKIRTNELRLKHEYMLKREEEKEEQKRIREEIREEEKAQRDFERARKQIEKEMDYYNQALKMAEAKYAAASIEERLSFKQEIDNLKEKLSESEERGKRALSMAQQTKTGNIYIVSNLGSFGENIYKIGMTRRLDPMDRVKELGDASVPFTFDVHAIVRCDNAPELEKKLHRVFEKHRVNKVNRRKEFFKLDLEEIESEINSFGGKVEYTRAFVYQKEAREFRETIELLKQSRLTFQSDTEQKKHMSTDELFSEN